MLKFKTTVGLEMELQFIPTDEGWCCLEPKARWVGAALV